MKKKIFLILLLTAFINTIYSQNKQKISKNKETVKSLPMNSDFIENSDDFNLHMVFVQGGIFDMGSNEDEYEKPIHSVSISNFHIGKFEVTQKQWRIIMGSDPAELSFKGCDNCPVERVSWKDVQEFILKLNNKTGKKYRLPLESEWEYAAKGGHKSNGYIYSGSNAIDEVAWYANNSARKTHPVGEKKPNELGIYDMSGNVKEWCEEWFIGYPNTNNSRASDWTGRQRTIRDGSWNFKAFECRNTNRSSLTYNIGGGSIGFRLALSK